MSQYDPEHDNHLPDSSEVSRFLDKLKSLLLGIEFEETNELLEARIAILEALQRAHHDPDLLKVIWAEYTKICEQIVDSSELADTDLKARAKIQIAIIVHKALIFHEAGNTDRYPEELTDAEIYAHNSYFDDVAMAIQIEIDRS